MYCVTSLISLQPTSKRMNGVQIRERSDGPTFLIASKNLRIIGLKFLLIIYVISLLYIVL